MTTPREMLEELVRLHAAISPERKGVVDFWRYADECLPAIAAWVETLERERDKLIEQRDKARAQREELANSPRVDAHEQTHRLVLEVEAHELRESLNRAERRIDAMAGMTDELRRERDEARTQRDKLVAALREVDSLVNESRGVIGYHLNGDEACWDELLAGGRFECLREFSAALASLDAQETP